MNLNPRQRALILSIPKMDAIRRAGAYRALIEEAQMRGLQPNPEWVVRHQRLVLWGQAHLSPQELHQANMMAEHAKHEFRNQVVAEERAQRDEENQAIIDKSVREMTHGMLGQPGGISQTQLQAIRGGKKIPKTDKPRPSQEALDAHWMKMTQRLDPKGKGWGEKEAIRRLDELADAKPEQRERLAREFRSGLNLQREAANWDEQRVEYGVKRKRVERDIQFGRRAPETTEPTARDNRRAHIVDAYLKTTSDQMIRDGKDGRIGQTYNDFEEVPYQLNEQHDGKLTRRAHIAQALVDSEEAEANGDGY